MPAFFVTFLRSMLTGFDPIGLKYLIHCKPDILKNMRTMHTNYF
jgi:hypothetical protein